MKENGRPFLLILLLFTVFSAFLSVNYKISKVKKYSESIDSGLADLQSQHNTLWRDVVSESEVRTAQIEQLQRENKFGKQADLEIARDLYKYARRQRRDNKELKKILGVDGKYDYNNVLIKPENLEKFLNYKVYVRTSVVLERPKELEGTDAPETTQRKVEAPAIIIGKYILMTAHTNDPDGLNNVPIRVMTPFGILSETVKSKVLEHKVELLAGEKTVSLIELYINKERDFSLFEIPANSFEKAVGVSNFPFKIGNSAELKIGNFIYMNGRPEIESEIARAGYVTALSVAVPNDGVSKEYEEFSISQITAGGDSGSSVIAFRDGKPELVGIYLGWVVDRGIRSRSLKIDVAIDEIKEKTGIDLRELQRQVLKK